MEFHDLYFHTELLASHQPAVVHCAWAGEREAVLVAVPCYQPAESSLPQRLFHSDLHSYSYSPTLERASYSRSVTRNSRSVCLSVFYSTIMITLSWTEDPISCQLASLLRSGRLTLIEMSAMERSAFHQDFTLAFYTVCFDCDWSIDWHSQQMTNFSTSPVKTCESSFTDLFLELFTFCCNITGPLQLASFSFFTQPNKLSGLL